MAKPGKPTPVISERHEAEPTHDVIAVEPWARRWFDAGPTEDGLDEPHDHDPCLEDLYTDAGAAVITRRPRDLASFVWLFVLSAGGWFGWTALMLPDSPVATDAMLGVPQHVATSADDERPPDEYEIETFSEEANYSGEAERLRPPRPGDWLHEFPEQGQTFQQYAAHAHNKRTEKRFVIYILPVGGIHERANDVLAATSDYVSAYYGVPTRRLPPISLPIEAFDHQRGQYNARKVLARLKRELPSDALGLLAVTEEDLFVPGVSWVFGLGSAQHHVSVYSLARYGDDYRLAASENAVFKRSMVTAVHEVGHVMSMRHCTAFRCAMNGTNSLADADTHPLHLCPVCIRKAEVGLRFDRRHRYEQLERFYRQYGFRAEAEFVERRLNPPPLGVPQLVEFIDGLGPHVIESKAVGKGTQ